MQRRDNSIRKNALILICFIIKIEYFPASYEFSGIRQSIGVLNTVNTLSDKCSRGGSFNLYFYVLSLTLSVCRKNDHLV